MSFDIRNTPDCIAYALVVANNQMLLDNISTKFHLTAYEATTQTDYKNPTLTRATITTADATVDTEAWALVNEIKVLADAHFTDTIAHDTATSAAVTIADATDTASAVSLANELKANFNTHFTASNVHYTNDDTNTVTNSDATDDPTLQVLVNELKAMANAHVVSAPSGTYINIVGA
jgi:hypothetical protein